MGCVSFVHEQLATVDGQNPKQPPFGCIPNPVNNGINYLSTGAGLSPSTVACLFLCVFFPYRLWVRNTCFGYSFPKKCRDISGILWG